MAITDIISEEEISTPNMEVAQGSPDDFMTDDEMDPYQDPEFQQLLDGLPMEQAEVLMQLIKEFKAMVAQGFEGEFEDFVKMKMASAQGGPEEFMTEDEMTISPEEQQSIIPMGQQVAQGGRIGYGLGSWVRGKLGLGRKEARAQASADRPAGNISDEELRNKAFNYFKNKYRGDSWKNNFREQWTSPFIQAAQGGRIGYQNAGPVGGGIMDVVAEEQIETGPTPQQLIMQWLEARGLPPTPENIQRAIIEMAREGEAPAMIRGQMDIPQMEMPLPPSGEDYVPEELIGQDISEVVTPQGIASSDVMIEETEEPEIMQTDDPIFYEDDEKKEWFNKINRLMQVEKGLSPDSYLRLKDDRMKEGVDKGFISEEDYLNKWQMPFFGKRGEDITKRIDDYRNWAFEDDKYAQGGRARYGLGSLVKSVFKGAKKGVKSLVKSVKKFAKSDLGKAALMYMATAGMANIGAGGWSGAQPWSGGQWLRPSNVMGLGQTGWGNIGKSLTNLGLGAGASTVSTAGQPIGASRLMPGATPTGGTGFLAGLGQSFKSNPMPWILGTAAGAGLYTKMNPGEDNLDEVMRNYAGEEAAWDKRMADIRAGRIKTPFSTDNTTYPYPDYMNLAAEGGRIGAQEGGLMDLGGMEKDYRAEGGFVPIGGKEKADDVPARLSRNEFVFTADAVRNAGGGDVDRGAEVMENVMTNLEQGGSISEESQGLEGARDMFEVSERLSEVV